MLFGRCRLNIILFVETQLSAPRFMLFLPIISHLLSSKECARKNSVYLQRVNILLFNIGRFLVFESGQYSVITHSYRSAFIGFFRATE